MAGFIQFKGQKQGEIKGESLDGQHFSWSDVISIGQGFTMPNDLSTHMASGRMQVESLRITKAIDSASVALMSAIRENENFTEVKVEVTRTYTNDARGVYLRMTLTDAHLVSYHLNGYTQSDEVPTEELHIAFQEMNVEYLGAGASGNYSGNMSTIINVASPQ
jgi:type VI secretion system Hcp family effector